MNEDRDRGHEKYREMQDFMERHKVTVRTISGCAEEYSPGDSWPYLKPIL